MSERLHEQLSALLDGELPAGEAQLLLARLQRDPALRATLSRYTLAGDAIRIASLVAAQAVEPVASAGFASRISAALEAEAQQDASLLAGLGVVEPPRGETKGVSAASRTSPVLESAPALVRGRRRLATATRWLRPLGGVAMAAGVAGLALMAMSRGPSGGSPDGIVASAAPAIPAANVTSVIAPSAAPAAVPDTPAVPVQVAAAPTSSPGLGTFDRSGEPASYTTPLSTGGPSPTFIPSAELASYVVAHSEVSGPLARRNVLTGLAADAVLVIPSAPQSPAESRRP